jgi:hypothetical protein
MEHRIAKEVLSLAFSLLIFLSYFVSFFRRERTTGRQQLVMQEDIRVHKGRLLLSWPRGVTAEAARQWAFA